MQERRVNWQGNTSCTRVGDTIYIIFPPKLIIIHKNKVKILESTIVYKRVMRLNSKVYTLTNTGDIQRIRKNG